jgi:thioredoxin 1
VNVDSQPDIARQYGVSAMPTFLIFRSGSVVQTLRGADPRGLTTAVENAVKLAGAAKSAYSTPGRTLGGPSGRPSQSLWWPLSWNINGFLNPLITFFGLYFISLFSVS